MESRSSVRDATVNLRSVSGAGFGDLTGWVNLRWLVSVGQGPNTAGVRLSRWLARPRFLQGVTLYQDWRQPF